MMSRAARIESVITQPGIQRSLIVYTAPHVVSLEVRCARHASHGWVDADWFFVFRTKFASRTSKECPQTTHPVQPHPKTHPNALAGSNCFARNTIGVSSIASYALSDSTANSLLWPSRTSPRRAERVIRQTAHRFFAFLSSLRLRTSPTFFLVCQCLPQHVS